MKKVAILLSVVLLIGACKKDTSRTDTAYVMQNEKLHLNEIQILASHNSYRIKTSPQVYDFLVNIASLLPANLDPRGLDYTHENFDVQMSDYGVRGLEIDIYNDPKGGDFYMRRIDEIMGLPGSSNIPDLLQPGLKVLHIKDVDYNTHYYTFKQALQALKNWSDNNPDHLPIFVNIETKQDAPGDNATLAGLSFNKAIPWDAAAADNVDNEVKAVFGENLEKILTPDKLRAGQPTLSAIPKLGLWPTLGYARGKIVFIMEGNGVDYYLQNHPSLKGRTMFVYAEEGTDEAAFIIKNGAKKDEEKIKELVKQGYIVRTRADSDTEEARTGDYSSMDAAFRSGAQIVSTDYYKADPRGNTSPDWTNYEVKMPGGGIARKNPINTVSINVDNNINQ